ncbi:arylamine N-acetyltransferase [Streptomyces sp. NPDC012794]|uniref:arylamine N-acetyltransferase n=1 Tax=Streptomyces sp. NPDC012794 TaxID=3364850 RepID=UPI0036C7449E
MHRSRDAPSPPSSQPPARCGAARGTGPRRGARRPRARSARRPVPPGRRGSAAGRRRGRTGRRGAVRARVALLLESLDYEVARHSGDVTHDPEDRAVSGGHPTLTVRVYGTAYWVDAGVGDGPCEALPLREGAYEQGGFRYVLERLEPLEGGGTRLDAAQVRRTHAPGHLS